MYRSLRVASFLVISTIILVYSKRHQVRFVTVVFRHGDRAPDSRELYPNDPYLHDNFYPMGQGGMTNKGKERVYRLGELLRSRYNNFLGSLYIPDDIVARSTDNSRTKMSLLLVLAGLYPPDRDQRWNRRLRWQPIPTTYVPDTLDVLLLPEECPRYIDELERVKSLPEVVSMVDEYRPLMSYLTNHTGELINDTDAMWILYHNLVSEQAVGLKLPEWTQKVFPDGELRDATVLEYDIFSYNDLLKRINGGTLLKRISDDMVAKLENGTVEARKMNLFGGHETNIAALLHTLGVWKPQIPEYASAVIVELITNDDGNYVRVLHYLGIPPDIEELTIPGCDVLCPIDDFLDILKNVTATKEDLYCPKNGSLYDSHKVGSFFSE